MLLRTAILVIAIGFAALVIQACGSKIDTDPDTDLVSGTVQEHKSPDGRLETEEKEVEDQKEAIPNRGEDNDQTTLSSVEEVIEDDGIRPGDPVMADAGSIRYGGDATVEGEPLDLTQALHLEGEQNIIKVQATVADVCQKKGCWMILSEDDRQVRVTFKDYGFFVPTDISGKSVVVEGVLSRSVLSQADARHYAEDAGKSREEIEQIVGDQEEFALVAETVLVLH